MVWYDRAVGIDLGTTNSACAMLVPEGDRVLVAEDEHGRLIAPSVVGYDSDAASFVDGYTAWHRRGLEPTPIESVKRKMGQLQALSLGPHDLLPSEVSARIVAHQVVRMRGFLGRLGGIARSAQDSESPRFRVERAVITVPAYFDAPQIDATRRAGELAGIDVLGLLQEPTAACMYFVWKRALSDANFLVYDLGGGTFDVSVIRCLMGEYQVLGIDGDNFLGGDDFDRRLAEHFRQHLTQRGYKLELDIQHDREDALRFMHLTRLARSVKEALTLQPVQYVAQRDIFRDQDGKMVTIELELSRGRWDAMMEDLVASTVRACTRALEHSKEHAGVGLEEIDYVLLVGGSTRSPCVQAAVRAAFCGDGKSRAEDISMEAPDTCVALGAAIHAANLGGVRVGLDAHDPATLGEAEGRGADELVGQRSAPSKGPVLHLSSPLATRRNVTRVVGVVAFGEQAPSDPAITIMLRDGAGATLAVEDLDPSGRFVLRDVPLDEDGAHPMALEFLAGNGATVVEFPIVLYRDTDLRGTGSALSNPTVLAKDIYLEVQRRGVLERQILLSRGRTLPARGEFRLFTADNAGAVVLTLLQNRFPISTIHLEVPEELAVGTPVQLHVEIDEKMSITASGGVAGQTFWATVDPPDGEDDRSWEAIEKLLQEADALGQRVWGHEAYYYRMEVPYLVSCIREAARTDPDKLRALVARLEENLEALRGTRGELTPGYDHYERLLDSVRRSVLRTDNALGMDFEGWKRRLEQMTREAKAAFEGRDHLTWERLNTQLQALYETVSQEESRFVRTDSIEHVLDLYRSANVRLGRLRGKLELVVLPAHAETRRLRAAALEELREEVEAQVADPLTALDGNLTAGPVMRALLERINTLAKQLEARLDRVPSLGVVAGEQE